MTASAPRTRFAAAVVGVFAPAAVIVATAALYGSRLPDSLPVHWSGITRPDGFASTSSVLQWTLGAAVLAAVIGTGAIAVLRRGTPVVGPLALAGGIGGVASAMWLTSVATTLPVDDPSDALLGWHVLWIPAGIAWAATFPMLAARRRNPSIGTPVRPDDPATRRTAWVSVLRPRWLATVPLVAAGGVAVFAVTTEPLLWPAVAVPLASLLLFIDLRVIVDRRGLRLVTGPFGTPLKRIPLTDIAAARTEHINPLKWGGWGYRVIPGRSALVLRSGPGLVLDLRDGRRFAVTVDEPDTPAALLTALHRSTN
jgi:hypothetical protein